MHMRKDEEHKVKEGEENGEDRINGACGRGGDAPDRRGAHAALGYLVIPRHAAASANTNLTCGIPLAQVAKEN